MPMEDPGCSNQHGRFDSLHSGRQRCSLSFVLVLLPQLARRQTVPPEIPYNPRRDHTGKQIEASISLRLWLSW